MRSLDLFTGIGGFSHALRGLATPVAYCEIDTKACAILRARMADGSLPTAPICHDVTQLDASWLSENGCAGGGAVVDLLTAGFPCQGFSPQGCLAGYEHAGSGLFNHIARLAGELAPPLILLENVPEIVRLGMDRIVDYLGKKHRYELRWCVLGALHLGAPHARRRWFCLAVDNANPRTASLLAQVAADEPPPLHQWTSMHDRPRMTLSNLPENRVRCAALGNAVVPDCVRLAFQRLSALPAVRPWRSARRAWPPCGRWQPPGGELGAWRLDLCRGQKRDYGLVFDPSLYHEPGTVPSAKVTSPLVTTPQRAARFSTPRHCMVHAVRFLTERGLRDLPNQLRFEAGTSNEERPGQMLATFVEWLMGYPPGWTEVPAQGT